MKGFLKKRWHSVPVGILTAVLAACLLTGGVFAAYSAWTGTATVTVDEAISVEFVAGDWSGNTLTVGGLMPGENFQGSVEVHNDSSVELSVTATMSQTGGTTLFQAGDEADIENCISVGPVPAYSWVALNEGLDPFTGVGTPITFTVPAKGSWYLGIGGQAGNSIVPTPPSDPYTFTITVER